VTLKGAKVEAVRSVLYAYPIGATLRDDDLMFVLSVLRGHPEWDLKRGRGIRSVQIEQNNFSSRGFWLTRIDGSRTDISYRKSLTAPSHPQRVKAAFRVEIWRQINAFKKRYLIPGARCAVSEALLIPHDTHVDHYDPVFEVLTYDFMWDNYLNFNNIKLSPTRDGVVGTDLQDREIALEWSKFHKDRANLRLVTKAVNLGVLRRTNA